MLGYKEEELIGKSVTEFTHPDDIHMGSKAVKKLFKKETSFLQFEKRNITKDKKTIWCRLSISVLENVEGVPKYTITIVEDITKRKEA